MGRVCENCTPKGTNSDSLYHHAHHTQDADIKAVASFFSKKGDIDPAVVAKKLC